MLQIFTANLQKRYDHTAVQKPVHSCQQVLLVLCMIRSLMEELKFIMKMASLIDHELPLKTKVMTLGFTHLV